MFNLPSFPTDSLYKFCFIFGLFLLMFGIYFSDSHLNRYDKKQPQYIIDSLTNLDSIRKKSMKEVEQTIDNFEQVQRSDDKIAWPTYNEINVNLYECKILDFANKTHLDSVFYNGLVYNPKHPLGDLQVNIAPFVLKQQLSYRCRQLHKKLIDNLQFNQNLLNKDKLSLRALIILGAIMFLVGTILWYFKIQKPQDKLLVMQVKQIEKQNIKLNTEFIDWQSAQAEKIKNNINGQGDQTDS